MVGGITLLVLFLLKTMLEMIIHCKIRKRQVKICLSTVTLLFKFVYKDSTQIFSLFQCHTVPTYKLDIL